MKKVALIFAVVFLATVGSVAAQVISVATDGIGDAGHAGTIADPLDIGETIGIKLVLEAGYDLSSMALNLELSGPGTLSWNTTKAGAPNLVCALSPFDYTNIDSDSIDGMSGISFAGITGPVDVLTGLYVTCTGQGGAVLDLNVNGRSDYRQTGQLPWVEATDDDLGDLTIYQPPIPTYTLTLDVGENGAVSLNPTGSEFDEGTVVSLTAVPNTGYHVASWSGTDDDTSMGATNTVTMNSDKTVTVTFEQAPPTYYHLTTQVATAGGTISPDSGDYLEGQGVTLTAIPQSGYRVASWSGTDDDTSTATTNTVAMTADKTVAVSFELITYTLSATVSGGHGSVSTNPVGPAHAENTVVTLTAVPDEDYRVSAWSGTDDDVSTGLTNSVTMNADKTVTVTFEEIPSVNYSLTVSVTNPAGGSVSPAGGTYPEGSVVDLTAAPAEGWRVASWTGTLDDTSTAMTNRARVDSDTQVTVAFEEIPQYFDLSAGVDGDHGQLSVDPNNTGPYLAGTVVDLTAWPDSGYQVSAWSGTDDDGSLSSTNTVTMDANRVVTVSFELAVVPDELDVTLFKVDADKSRDNPQDDFIIKGSMLGAAEDDFLAAGYVMFAMFTAQEDIYVSEGIGTGSFNVNKKKPIYKYSAKVTKTSPEMLKKVVLNFDNGTFEIAVSHADLTGLAVPFGAELDFIDAQSVAQWQGIAETVPESAIKGGSVPTILLMGHSDTLSLKKQPKVNKKQVKLVVAGELSIADLDLDFCQNPMTIRWDDQSFVLPAGSFVQKKDGIFKAAKIVVDAELNTKVTAAINLNNGSISVKVTGAQALAAEGIFGLSFGTYDQQVQWTP